MVYAKHGKRMIVIVILMAMAMAIDLLSEIKNRVLVDKEHGNWKLLLLP